MFVGIVVFKKTVLVKKQLPKQVTAFYLFIFKVV